MDEIKGNAPRVTPEDLEAEIASEHYFTAADGVMGELAADGVPPTPFERQNLPETLRLLTFCVLVLKNGIKVTGESACVSAENFDAGIGREVARMNAIDKLWPLLGFRLADKLRPGDRGTIDDQEALCAVKATRIPIERPDLFDRIKKALRLD